MPKLVGLSAPSSFACGMKSPFASLHVRVALCTRPPAGLAMRVKVGGFGASRYLPMLNFTRRLAVCRTDRRTTPSRGVTFFQCGTPVTSSNEMLRVGTCGPGPSVCAGTTSFEVVEPHAGVDRHPLERPLILRRTRPSSDSGSRRTKTASRTPSPAAARRSAAAASCRC